jgi:hypothetical protein
VTYYDLYNGWAVDRGAGTSSHRLRDYRIPRTELKWHHVIVLIWEMRILVAGRLNSLGVDFGPFCFYSV